MTVVEPYPTNDSFLNFADIFTSANFAKEVV